MSASSTTSCRYVFPVQGALLCFIQVQGVMFYSSSVKETFRLSVNHDQIPSMPVTHQSKHNDSEFKKGMKILAGGELLCSNNRTPNWNVAWATKKKTTCTAKKKKDKKEKKKKNPQQREHRFAQRRRSRQHETGKTRESLQRLETWTDSCNWRNHGICSLPLYSIQFNPIVF